ncbi:hypothetical protein [Microbacterium halophytorum]|uniref:hypothetical protein n=1 Tax=Microbacterium halophytorum TaxID=2067568 RepID=UPI000CFCB08C|nr:hypothetical protein [Microbacterium halophytorum]
MGTSKWQSPDVATIRRSDQIALWIIATAFIALAAYGLVRAAIRVVELSGSGPVAASLSLPDTPVPELAEGATASAIDVTVQNVDPGTRAFLIASEVFAGLGWAAFYVLVALFLIQVARRVAFARRMPALLMTAAFALLVGQGVSLQLGTAASAGISEQLGLGFATRIDPVTLIVLPVLLIAIAFVLGAGRRLQKDTEGLV